MENRCAYQIKFVIKRPGFKDYPTCGIVLATSQAIAVAEAKRQIADAIKDAGGGRTEKLESVRKLPTDFFILAQESLGK
jgi:hypothetical protein